MDNYLTAQQFTITAILDAINHDIVLLDEDNNVDYVNVKGKSHIFSEIKDLEGANFKNVIQDLISRYEIESSEALYELFVNVSKPGAFLTNTIKISLTKSMKKIYEVSTSPIYDSKLGHLGRVWQFRDITVQENLDAAKSEFISIASHQLRTPLTSIRGYVDMILQKDFGKFPENLQEPLDAIFKSSNEMSELVNDLLNMSRLERGTEVFKIDSVNIKELIDEVREIFGQKLQLKNQKLVINGDPEAIEAIMSDKNKLRESLKNLVENAIKYSPEGSNVTLSVSATQKDLKFQVTDQGVGIPKNQQDKIFQKFFRAANVLTENFEGTGLGLYYVKKVIEQLGGTVSFESKENVGTTFTITLPYTKN